MRLFFPLVSVHETIPDREGVEVVDVRSAQTAALEVLSALRDDSSGVLDFTGWTLMAVDSSGTVIFSLDLDSPIR